MAILYPILPIERWTSLQTLESHSYNFCFSDCSCPKAELLEIELEKHNTKILNQHVKVIRAVKNIGKHLFQNPSQASNPFVVQDAIQVFLCHNASLPCDPNYKNNYDLNLVEPKTDSVDIINIDEFPLVEEIKKNEQYFQLNEVDQNAECIQNDQVDEIFSFTRKQNAIDSSNLLNKNLRKLRGYGLLRHIVNTMLKIISGDKLKFVLYSSHSKSIQNLAISFGLNLTVIPYAARINFEIYKSQKNDQFYIRLIYNGLDVTNKVNFCENNKSLRVNRGKRGQKAYLCPIENIIRFIHEDYFLSLNATNFKDACSN